MDNIDGQYRWTEVDNRWTTVYGQVHGLVYGPEYGPVYGIHSRKTLK